MKMDLAKAYETIDHEFIKLTMLRMRFAPQFVGWILFCISTPTYSVNINGEGSGKIGLRQGLEEPLLFVLATEI